MELMDEVSPYETVVRVSNSRLVKQKIGFDFEHIAVYDGAECQKCGGKFKLEISIPDADFRFINEIKTVRKSLSSIEFDPVICPLCRRIIIYALEEETRNGSTGD